MASTRADPVAGYSDNLLGALGVAFGAITGFLRVVPCNFNVPTNLVAADITINSILMIAKRNAELKGREPTIFNLVCNNERISGGDTFSKFLETLKSF